MAMSRKEPRERGREKGTRKPIAMKRKCPPASVLALDGGTDGNIWRHLLVCTKAS
jgi:hypothetical protein